MKEQKSLFSELTGNFEIKKHSSLVQMSNVTTLHQRKAINVLIRIAKDQLKRNPDSRMFNVDLGVIKKLTGVHSTDNTKLKNAVKKLVSLVIEYNVLGKDKEERRGVFSFLSSAHIV